MANDEGVVLLFYKYVWITERGYAVAEHAQWHRNLCMNLGLKGKLRISREGINGTLAGSKDAVAQYQLQVNDHPLFATDPIEWKTSCGHGELDFDELSVRVVEEIITLGIPPEQLPYTMAGHHLTPAEFHAVLADPPQNLVLIDCRNEYDCIDKGENEGTGIHELMEKAVLEGVVMPGDGHLCAVQGLRVSAGDEISIDSEMQEQSNKEEKEEKVLGKRSRRLKIRPRLFAENDGTRSLMMEYATEPPPFLMDNPFEANEIIPGLYLGDYSSASKKQDLKQRGITHILNCARSARKWFPQEFKYHHLLIDDHPLEDILHHFEFCCNFIQDCLNNKGAILVHCVAGISRSASVVCAFLMKVEKYSLEKALTHLQDQRPIVRPNPGFMEQLLMFEAMDCCTKGNSVAHKEYKKWKKSYIYEARFQKQQRCAVS